MGDKPVAALHSEAQRLAVNGKHQAALKLLDRIPAPEGAALRARIYCQQGLFAKGAQYWKEALAASPDDESRRGLALAERLARSPMGRVRLHARRWLLGLVIVAVVAAGALAAWRGQPSVGSRSSRELSDSLSQLERQMTALSSTSRAGADALTQRLDREQNATAQSQEQIRGQLQRIQQSLRRVEKNLGQQPGR